MNIKLKKLIFLAAVMSIFSPYLIGRVRAEKEPQPDCELRRTETVVQAGLTNYAAPKADGSTIDEAPLRGNKRTADKSAHHCAGGWNGRFKFVTGQDERGRYEEVIDITCDTDSNCTAQKSLQLKGKEILEPPIFDGSNPTPIPTRLPFNLDKMVSTRFRRSVLDLANVTDFPRAAPYFEPGIYRQIGTPNHVVECRANILLMICKLDAPLVRDDYGILTAWIILFPDMSSGPGCPGFGCPHALTKFDHE
jgi:hypothetical protein